MDYSESWGYLFKSSKMRDIIKEINEQMNRKAEISTSFVVTMVLLVIGFMGLLIFYFNISPSGEIDRTICHDSVIFRATLPSLIEDYIPLKCKTNKICLTPASLKDIIGKKKECPDFEGEKGITTVRVRSVRDIEKIYARETVQCWEAIGEGKVSLFTQYIAKKYGVGGVYPTCVICTRIAFDAVSFAKSKIDISKMDVARYMAENKMPGKDITYFEYLAGQDGKVAIKEKLVDSMPELKATEVTKDGKTELKVELDGDKKISITTVPLSEIVEDPSIQTKESAIIFMQISSPTQWGTLGNIGKVAIGTVGAAAIIAPSLTGKVIKFGLSLCTKSWVGAAICGLLAITGAAAQPLYVAHNRAVTSVYCGDVSVGTEARNGCSAVRVVNYEPKDIAQYCSVIESIP